MKKNSTRKALAGLLIVGTVLTMSPVQAFADTGVTAARLFGADRVETAVAVANAGWTTTDTAILAPSADANLVDALAAAPLAGKATPILLTENDSLNVVTANELGKLGVTKVYVVGAINQPVIDQLTAMGITPTVLKGEDRTATAAAISSKLTNPAGSFVVGYDALADALSVASYAAANNYSILVANPDGTLPESEAAYKGAEVNIIGGPTLVKDIEGAKRYYGADRFATNQAVLHAFTYQYDNVYVANGTDAHLVDSLVASSLAAKSGAPIVLADDNSVTAAAEVYGKLAANAVVTALGGKTVVTDEITTQLIAGDTEAKALEAATTAVVKAEESKLQADVTAAQDLVTALPDGTDKTALQDRIDAIVVAPTALETATAAVVKAEESKLQADVTAAQDLVTALPDGTDKTALQDRIDAIVVAPTALETATAAVEKAEGSKLQADVTAAQDLVTALPDGTDKTALQARIDAIVVE
ncbi:cell wall-binding repeat-containing protein [Desulfitobacterium sp. AusDCA]|uniref:cell wall-binding repeat-containing protein n=1 Tax=Desulfitobacterium sp. AusDCA TaxID=3240383 RepID=UPI003DA7509D